MTAHPAVVDRRYSSVHCSVIFNLPLVKKPTILT
jgi:hypothetical protein